MSESKKIPSIVAHRSTFRAFKQIKSLLESIDTNGDASLEDRVEYSIRDIEEFIKEIDNK